MHTHSTVLFEDTHQFLRVVQFYLLKNNIQRPRRTVQPNRLMYMAFVTANIYRAHTLLDPSYSEMDLIPNVISPAFKSSTERPLQMTQVLPKELTKAPLPYPWPEPNTVNELIIKPLYFVPKTPSEWLCHFILKDVMHSYGLLDDHQLDEIMILLTNRHPKQLNPSKGVYNYEDLASIYIGENPLNELSTTHILNHWLLPDPVGRYHLDQPTTLSFKNITPLNEVENRLLSDRSTMCEFKTIKEALRYMDDKKVFVTEHITGLRDDPMMVFDTDQEYEDYLPIGFKYGTQKNTQDHPIYQRTLHMVIDPTKQAPVRLFDTLEHVEYFFDHEIENNASDYTIWRFLPHILAVDELNRHPMYNIDELSNYYRTSRQNWYRTPLYIT